MHILSRSMLVYALVVTLLWSASINHGLCEYMGTSETLRSNLSYLLRGECDFSDQNLPYDPREVPDSTPADQSEYDFIVVGAGSGGSVVASRLSEMESFTVLLIEAGGKEYSIMDIPAMAGTLQLHDSIKWDYRVEPNDKYCLGFENGQCNWNRGKVMGGNSVFNYMLATRSNKEDYNEWARLTGDDSWSHDNMLNYFKKLEQYNVKKVEFDKNLHNTDGPLPITDLPYRTQLGKAFVEGGQELGYSGNTDYNGNRQIGFSFFQINVKDGERWSANRAYLRPARDRKNLKLTQNSLVEKVLIDNNRRAYGVRFSKAGKTYEVKARKEVILSAGSINSAQILMLSGIGPDNHLRSLGIQYIKNSPVGQNLMDHYAYGGLVFKVNDSTSFNYLPDVDSRKNSAVEEYIENHSGPLAFPTAFEALGYINVDDLGRDNDRPNIEFMFAPMAGMKDPVLAKVVKIDPKYVKIMEADNANHSYWTAWPMMMTPKSRGRILLRSNKITDKPKIIPNYFGHPDDIRVMRKGLKEILRLSETKAFKKFGSEMYRVPLPNCQHLTEDSDEYWECAMRTYPFTIYHHSGTCRMGKEDHQSSVVDPKLQVIGVRRLRVVDAGIMPKIVSAHPHIAVVSIAEKICDDIKKQYEGGKDESEDPKDNGYEQKDHNQNNQESYNYGENYNYGWNYNYGENYGLGGNYNYGEYEYYGEENGPEEYGNGGNGYGNRGNGYGNSENGYGNGENGHSNGGNGYGNGENGVSNGENGYGNVGNGYGNGETGNGYGHEGNGYGNGGNRYGNRGNGYGKEEKGYSNVGKGHGYGGNVYGNQGNGYGNQGNGYRNQENGYKNQENGYENQRNGYGTRGNGYGNSGNGYSNKGNGYGK